MPTDASLLLSTPRPYKFPVLEAELWLWVKEASQQGKTLTDAVQREQAWQLGGELGYTPEKFKASSGWFEYSKHHHGIRRGQYFGQGKMHKAIHAYAGEAYVNSDLRDFARESMLEDRAREDAEAAATAAPPFSEGSPGDRKPPPLVASEDAIDVGREPAPGDCW